MKVYTKLTSTRLSFASFLMGIGSLILVNPYQFYTPEYTILHRAMDAWGIAFILLGAAILTTNLIHLARWVEIIIYTLTGLVLLLLAAGFARTGFWLWASNYALLGIFTLLFIVATSKTRAAQTAPKTGRSLDLLGLFCGLVAVANGLVLLLAPQTLHDQRYELIRPYALYIGLLALSAGILLLAVQVGPRMRPRLEKVAYIWASLFFLTYFFVVPLRGVLWPGRLFYGGFGLFILVLPWLKDKTRWLGNPALLYTRVSLLLVMTMAIPLITTVTLISRIQDRTTTNAVLARQQKEASLLAETVYYYINSHRAALHTLAQRPGLLEMDKATLSETLQRYARTYPNVLAFSVYSEDGELVSRSDGRISPPLREYSIFIDTASTLLPSTAVYISPSVNLPIFALSEPLFDESGNFRGIVMISIDSQQVSKFINQQGDLDSLYSYLVDGDGRVISHPDSNLVSSFENLSGQQEVQALLNSVQPSGGLIVGPVGDRALIGYARVPELRWGVITVNPASLALATVQTGSNLAYAVLLIFLLVFVTAGVLTARQFSRPLETLSQAATELAAGNSDVPLPSSNVVEIQDLVNAFQEMRQQLQQHSAERERAEQDLLRANEELESRVAQRTADLETTTRALRASNNELQDFAYIASHDLQEPLRKILAFGDRLRSRSAGNLSADSLDSLERMQSAAERMQKMINDLLAYSRVTTKARPLVSVDLDTTVREVLMDLEVRLDQTHGSVEVGPLPHVNAEATQMQQLFQNLISNALKFHRPDVPPVIKIYCEESSNDGIKLVVEDNGIGFEENYAERIFQPFQRLHSRGTFEGNGIGLAICRKIVDRHGGQIHATSILGQGSCFIITLPKAAITTPQGEPE